MKHHGKAFLIFLFLLFYCGTDALAQKAEDYFPLGAGMKYTYLGAFKANTYKETVITREFHHKGLKVIYFIQESKIGKPYSSINANMIGLGAYSSGAEGIYTYQCIYTDELDKLSDRDAHLLFHKILKQGDSLRVTAYKGKMTLALNVIGLESVSVPAGTFADAVKIQLQEIWPDKTYKGYAWFAKGVGLVKWIRSTGRVDVLTSFRQVSTQPIAE